MWMSASRAIMPCQVRCEDLSVRLFEPDFPDTGCEGPQNVYMHDAKVVLPFNYEGQEVNLLG